VRDRREVRAPADVAAACIGHLHESTRGGHIRSTITVFAPDRPGRPGPRIDNDQLVRYAGYRTPSGVHGDGRNAELTDRVLAAGWTPPEPRGRFDVLPSMISDGGAPEIYSAAPFNGWYLNTGIGVRNLADTDRYNLLPVIAARMGLDTRSMRTLWKDRALVELVTAVQHSFDLAGATMADHHTESERFLTHVTREEAAGRRCPADWSWIVPPFVGRPDVGVPPVLRRSGARDDARVPTAGGRGLSKSTGRSPPCFAAVLISRSRVRLWTWPT
jgi:nitric-oxide synthase, bacterial